MASCSGKCSNYCGTICPCNGYCICNTNCTGGYYAVGTRGTILFTDPVLSTSSLIRSVHIDELRYAIDTERAYRLAKYGTTPWTYTSVYPLPPSVSNVRGVYWTELRNALNGIPGYTAIEDTYSVTDLVSKTKLETLRAKVKAMRSDCVCNSDCNGFSTCSCHEYCSCNSDCGCNY